MSTTDHICDVAFVGAGISTLIAAAELARAGRRVVIIERTERDRIGGQCRDAFGGLFFVGTPEQRRAGVKDSAELAWEDWQGYAEFGPGSERQQYWAKRYIERCVPDVREWMTGQDLSFFPTANWAERAHDGRGNRVPRFHLLWGCGPALLDVALRAVTDLEGRGITLLTGHRAEELVSAAGRVVAVRGVTAVRGVAAGRPFEVAADHVVIAAGGITGDLDRVRKHWPRDVWGEPPEDLLCGVWPDSDGRMHDAAAAAGAHVQGLENLWVYVAGVQHLNAEYEGHGLALIPFKSALWLDANGRRFRPPLMGGFDTRDALAQIAASGHTWSWLVLNRKILERELAIQGAQFNPAFRERSMARLAKDLAFGYREMSQRLIDECPDVVTAPDLGTLTARMGALTPHVTIDGAGMAADVAAYDGQIERGRRFMTDPQLIELNSIRRFLGDRMRTSNMRPIAAGADELVAIRVRPCARKTLGGIVTDESCRVLDDAGRPVEGLYALGESAGFGGGGMNGKRTLEGTLLGGCILTARDFARQMTAGA